MIPMKRFGYHASMLPVVKEGDDYYECIYYYSDDLPDWCSYRKTNHEGDSTFPSNWDDNVYYGDDVETLDEELVHILMPLERPLYSLSSITILQKITTQITTTF